MKGYWGYFDWWQIVGATLVDLRERLLTKETTYLTSSMWNVEIDVIISLFKNPIYMQTPPPYGHTNEPLVWYSSNIVFIEYIFLIDNLWQLADIYDRLLSWIPLKCIAI